MAAHVYFQLISKLDEIASVLINVSINTSTAISNRLKKRIDCTAFKGTINQKIVFTSRQQVLITKTDKKKLIVKNTYINTY